MRSCTLRTLAVAVGVLLISACGAGDGVTAPQRSLAPTAASNSLLGSAVTVTPLKRATPLPTPLTTAAYIGALGGRLSIPAAGISVMVPPLALTSTKLVTVTALAGSDVAYTFEPHGTTFLVPLVVTQDLRKTEAQSGGLVAPSALFVGYFPDSNNVLSVTELLNVSVNLLNRSATFTVSHFSGYIVASGRSE